MTTKEKATPADEPKESPELENPPPVAEDDQPPIEEPQDKPPRRRPLSGRRKRSDAGKPRGKRTTTSAPRAAGGSAVMTRKLRGVINTVGGVISLVEPFDGAVILQNADALAGGWAKVADRHPRVRQAIDGMEAGGVYGAAIAATLAVAVPILAHHRMLPPALLVVMGLEPPPAPDVTRSVPREPAPPQASRPAPEPGQPVAPPRTGPPPPATAAPTGQRADGEPAITGQGEPMPFGSGAPSGAPLPKVG